MAESVKQFPAPILAWLDARLSRSGAWSACLRAMKIAVAGLADRPCFCHDTTGIATNAKGQCGRCEALERTHAELTRPYPCIFCGLSVDPLPGHLCPRCGQRLPEEIEQPRYNAADITPAPQSIKFFGPWEEA